jgi:monoamine oxidase
VGVSETPTVDAVVVGAGISGLATAHALLDAGLTVVVLEARGRTGGRLLGSPFDLGASWFWPGEERVRILADRWGISTFDQYRTGDTVIDDLDGVHRYPGNLIDVPAYRMVGGTSRLASALTEALPPGVLVRDSPVTSISDDLAVRAADREWLGGHVVLALPPALAVASISLPGQVPQHLIDAARRTPVWMSDAVKVVAHYPEPFWRSLGLAGAAMSRRGPLQEIHDMSGPGGEPAALFGFARPVSLRPGVDDEIRAQLARMYGAQAAEPKELLIQDWSKERRTTPAAATGPADYAMFGHPAFREPAVDGRLHWASTETAESYAGHIEGALEASERTVRTILQSRHIGLSEDHR